MIPSLQTGLEAAFKDAQVTVFDDNRMDVFVPGESAHVALHYLKDAGLDRMPLLSCVDRIEEGKFEVVYVLTCHMPNNTDHDDKQNIQVFLKTGIRVS